MNKKEQELFGKLLMLHLREFCKQGKVKIKGLDDDQIIDRVFSDDDLSPRFSIFLIRQMVGTEMVNSN